MNKTNTPSEATTYCTGSTVPPKSRTGMITVLLIMVIVLSTIVTVLSMMNIHLFRLLEKEDETPIQFSQSQNGAASTLSTDEEDIFISPLGLTGREIPAYYRRYHNLPVGLYVTDVTQNSPAARANIQNGDIIVNINGTPITCRECLQNAFPASRSLTDMDVTIYRDEEEITHRITP